MASLTFEKNTGTVGSPTRGALGGRLVFSGSATDLTASIATTGWQDGTHQGSGTPGTDGCGGGPNSSHLSNVKFLTTSTMSLNGAASANITDANLAEGACSCRVRLQNASAISSQNTFLFCFDNTTDTAEAVEIEAYGFERGVSATAWTQLNDDSANIGGDNSGERLDVSEKSSVTDASWYFALSARGESAGGKSAFAFKLKTEVY